MLINSNEMAKIGIGVTTFNRPECLKECLEHIFKHTLHKVYLLTDYDYCVKSLTNQHDFELGKNLEQIKIYVARDTDEDRQGVAFRKNECLRALKDCDYVFLFDDDCFPIKDGWVENWTKRPSTDGLRTHFLFMNDKIHQLGFKYGANYPLDISYYTMCGGCFMAMSKADIEKVGAFDEKFEKYGFEHANWSLRCESHWGIVGKQKYWMLNNTSEYIYSHDYSTPNHKSSITDEEKNKCVKNNWNKFFNSEIKDVYLPL